MPKLAIDIEARFAQVMDAFDQIGRKADSQARAISSSFKAAGAVLAGAFSFAALQSQIGALDRTRAMLADIDDAAKVAGSSVENFSQAFFWLQPTGVQIGQLTDMAGLLQRQLASGGETGRRAAAALAEVGVKARDAAGNIRDPIVVLREFARALDGYENNGNKVALVNEALGRSAAQYLPILGNLANVTEDSARVTGDLTSRASELGDKLERIRQQGDLLRINFLEKYIDDIIRLTDRFTALSRNNGVIDSLVGTFAPGVASTNLEQGIAYWEGIEKRIVDLMKNPRRGSVGADGLLKPHLLESYTNQLARAQSALVDLRRQQEELNKALAGTPTAPDGPKPSVGARGATGTTVAAREAETEAQRIAKWMAQQEQAAARLNILEQAALKIAEAREKSGHGITAAVEEEILARARALVEQEKARALAESRAEFEVFMARVLDTEARRVEALAGAWRNVIDPAEQYRQKLREIGELEERGGLNSVEAGMARDAVLEQMAALDRQKESLDEIDQYARNAAESMQKHFADFLFDPFEDGLKGLARSFASTVRRMVADAMAAQLMKALFGDYASSGSVGGFLGSLFGAVGGGLSTNTTGTNLRLLEGQHGIDYGGMTVASSGVSIQNTYHVAGGASRADMIKVGELSRDQAIAEIQSRQERM